MKRRISIVCLVVTCLIVCLFVILQVSKDTESVDPYTSSEAESSVPEVYRKPSEYDPFEALMLCQEQVENAQNFSAQTQGTCDTQVMFLNFRQQIVSERYVSKNKLFLQSVCDSSLIRVGLQQYIDGENIFLREGAVYSADEIIWNDIPVAVTRTAYQDALGACSDGLSCYLLNKDTIRSARYVSEKDGLYSFTYDLDPELAGDGYEKQLQTLGMLAEPPVFNTVTITVAMDENFLPVSVEYEEEYSIAMDILGVTTCKAEYTETFFDFNTTETFPEEQYFKSYISLEPTEQFPKISNGYNLLFSLFDDNSSYNLNIAYGETAIPLHLTLDAISSSVYLQGEDFSFLFSDERYYLEYGATKVYTDAEAFNKQVLPFSEIASTVPEANNDVEASGVFSDLKIRTENGNLIIESGNETQSFSAVLEIATHSLLSLEISLTVSDQICRISMEKSPLKAAIPSVAGYQNITESVSALSYFGKLGGGGHFLYRLETEGAVSFGADITLSVQERISLSLSSKTKSIPISAYLKGDHLTAIIDNVSVAGSISEYTSFLKLFSSTKEENTRVRTNGYPILFAEKEKLVLRFADTSAEIELTPSCLVYKTNELSVRLELLGVGEIAAEEAPETETTVRVTDLNSFFAGSVYPELFQAGTLFGDLSLQYNGETYLFRVNASDLSNPSIGLTTTWNGLETALIYSDDTLYLSNSVLNAYVPIEQLETVIGRALSSSGYSSAKPAVSAPVSSISISCSEDQLSVFWGEFELRFTKQSAQLISEKLHAVASDFSFSEETASIAHPDKNDSIDLFKLSEKITALYEQEMFSFAGKYVNDGLSATVDRLDFQINKDGTLQRVAIDLLMESATAHSYSLCYDGEAIYLDADGIKLFALAEQLLTPFVTSASESHIMRAATASAIDFSNIRSVTFDDDILTVEMTDAILSITWNEEQLTQILFVSKSQKLLLKQSVFAPIKAPSLEGYADISPIGELLSAVYKTTESGSFGVSGKMELNLLSMSLQDIVVNGSFAFDENGTKGYLCIDIPYIQGVTSKDVPLLRGLKPLSSCSVKSEIYIENSSLYFCKTITAQYGFFQMRTETRSEKRYMTFEEFLQNPEQALAFLANLKDSLFADGTETRTGDPAVKNPIKRFSCIGNTYLLELIPDAVFPEAETISISAKTDGIYLVGMDAEIKLPLISMTLSGVIMDHGNSDVITLDHAERSSYLPFHSLK